MAVSEPPQRPPPRWQCEPEDALSLSIAASSKCSRDSLSLIAPRFTSPASLT